MTKKSPPVTLRPARLEDGERAYEWRNASATRIHSRNPAPLHLQSHLRWWEGSLGNPSRVLLIAEDGDTAVGVIRFDLDGNSAEISIYLDPDERGRGLGPKILVAGCAWIGLERKQVNLLTAVISEKNPASLRAFEKAGFRRAGRAWIRRIDRGEQALSTRG